jgi:predicted branched-subunit amino acid permease
MLLPRFTLRTTLVGITCCALFCLVLVRAAAGDYWAIAASVAVASLVVIVSVHACMYVVIAALARLLGGWTLPAHTRQGGVQANPDEQYLPGTIPPSR